MPNNYSLGQEYNDIMNKGQQMTEKDHNRLLELEDLMTRNVELTSFKTPEDERKEVLDEWDKAVNGPIPEDIKILVHEELRGRGV